MAHPGAYRGNKRQKELKRLEKQEAKRLRRQHKITDPEGDSEQPFEGPASPNGTVPELQETPSSVPTESGDASPRGESGIPSDNS